MVVNNGGLNGVCYAVTVEIPQQFLLFRIHTQYRIACFEVLLFQMSNVLELGVAISMLFHCALLLRFPTTKTKLMKQSRYDISACWCGGFLQFPGNGSARQVCPFQSLAHKVASRMVIQDRKKVVNQLRKHY